MMKRRKFFGVVAGLAVAPLAAANAVMGRQVRKLPLRIRKYSRSVEDDLKKLDIMFWRQTAPEGCGIHHWVVPE